MKKYILYPKREYIDSWPDSVYKGKVEVVDEDESKARRRCAKHYQCSLINSSYQDTNANPWDDDLLVTCDPIEEECDEKPRGPIELE